LAKLEVQPLDENKAGKEWTVGKRKGLGQNLARSLMEAPSNVMTPREFAKVMTNRICQKNLNRDI
jgi:leucyl aminopeptidase